MRTKTNKVARDKAMAVFDQAETQSETGFGRITSCRLRALEAEQIRVDSVRGGQSASSLNNQMRDGIDLILGTSFRPE